MAKYNAMVTCLKRSINLFWAHFLSRTVSAHLPHSTTRKHTHTGGEMQKNKSKKETTNKARLDEIDKWIK